MVLCKSAGGGRANLFECFIEDTNISILNDDTPTRCPLTRRKALDISMCSSTSAVIINTGCFPLLIQPDLTKYIDWTRFSGLVSVGCKRGCKAGIVDKTRKPLYRYNSLFNLIINSSMIVIAQTRHLTADICTNAASRLYRIDLSCIFYHYRQLECKLMEFWLKKKQLESKHLELWLKNKPSLQKFCFL